MDLEYTTFSFPKKNILEFRVVRNAVSTETQFKFSRKPCEYNEICIRYRLQYFSDRKQEFILKIQLKIFFYSIFLQFTLSFPNFNYKSESHIEIPMLNLLTNI